MRRMLLLAAAVLSLSLSASGAQALSSIEQAAYTTVDQQLQASSLAVAWADEASTSPRGSSAARSQSLTAFEPAALGKEVGSTLRTAFVLGFAGLVLGLGAVGLKSLWVVEEAEFSTLSHEFRNDPFPGGGRMLSCLGDHSA